MRRSVKILLCIISGVSIIICTLCCLYIYQYFRGGMLNDKISRLAFSVADEPAAETPPQQTENTPAPSAAEDPDEPEAPTMDIDIDFAALKDINDEIYAWIEIPGTNISYAVVQNEDDLYYNTHSIDKAYYTGGSIFSQSCNSKDFTDPVTVLYGHNLRSQTMFSLLNNFADVNFFESNRYIFIYSPEKVFQYEIFAACPHSSEHLLLCHDFSDAEEFDAYFTELQGNAVNANFADELFPAAGDRVIALSTCYSQNRWQRFIVYGVLTGEYTVAK